MSVRRRGFSLIIVLIIAIIGLAVVGAAVQLTMTSGGAGRTSSAINVRYNFLQDAVEEGKAALKAAMDNTDTPPRYLGYATSPRIDLTDDLLVSHDFGAGTIGIVKSDHLTRSDLGRLGISGNGGTIVVGIYDMQYAPESVEISDATELKKLPPSIKLASRNPWSPGESTAPEGERAGGGEGSVANTGVYLIRASLTINGKEDTPSVLDTAIIQSNNM